MKNLLFLAVIFAAVLVFSSNSYSQCSEKTTEKTSEKSSEKKSCCTESNSSSGEQVQSNDSANSDMSICPVSKEEFKKGKGKTVSYLGKKYEFCCPGCVAEFKAEPIGYTGGVARCPICDEDDAKATISSMHDGTKYYFCNEKCKTEFGKDPEKILEGYNK